MYQQPKQIIYPTEVLFHTLFSLMIAWIPLAQLNLAIIVFAEAVGSMADLYAS
jgi:hypothetical protein